MNCSSAGLGHPSAGHELANLPVQRRIRIGRKHGAHGYELRSRSRRFIAAGQIPEELRAGIAPAARNLCSVPGPYAVNGVR